MFKNGMAGMMQKAQKMQEGVQKAQAEIKQLTVVGQAANGTVKIHLSGDYNANNVEIDDNMPTDKSVLEDLILTAINDANRQINEARTQKMKAATGGIDLPSGIKLPF